MIIIPARLASTRFENKILSPIFGVPMVIATARRVKNIDEVIIACDNKDVKNLCEKYGFKAILTSLNHQSGTDRINEAVNLLNLKDDEIIINVQADEPFIEPRVVNDFIKFTKQNIDVKCFMTSCYKTISSEEANNPNTVKVVTDINNNALYFSRSKIPYNRGIFDDYNAHLGIYGFNKKNLNTFCSLKQSSLELAEKLEQLRALENGKSIRMLKVKSSSFGIDSQEDLQKAIKFHESSSQ